MPKGGQELPYHDTKCWLACTALPSCCCGCGIQYYSSICLLWCKLSYNLSWCVRWPHLQCIRLEASIAHQLSPRMHDVTFRDFIREEMTRLALLFSRMMNLSHFPILWSLLSTLRLIPVLFFSLRLSLVRPFIEFLTYLTYMKFIFSQASERAGCLNPRIWLANLTHVTGPAFYDTAHGPDFFPLDAVPKFRF